MTTGGSVTRRWGLDNKLFVFGLVWLGQVVSLVGSGLTGFSLRVWAYEHTGSVTQFALIAFFYSFPGIVLAPVAGVLVDRWDRRWAMILSDAGSALSPLAIWLLSTTGRLEIWHIYLAVAGISIFSTFQGPAFTASTTLLVPKDHFGRTSGMMRLGPAASQIIAPFFGGLLFASIGLNGVVTIDLATFLFAVLILLVVRIPRPAVIGAVTGGVGKGVLLHDAAYAWNYMKSRPNLTGLLLFEAVVSITENMSIVLIAPLVLSFANVTVLGAVSSIAGIGMLLGALSMSAWGGPKRRIKGMLGFTLLRALLLLMGGLQPSVALIAVAASTFLFFAQIAGGCAQAIWQVKVAPEVQGRVFAMRQLVFRITTPMAQILVGPLADRVFQPLLARDGPLAGSVGRVIGSGPGRGIGLMFIVLGVINLLLVIVGYLYPRVRLIEDELPDAIGDNEAAGQGKPILFRRKKMKRVRKWLFRIGMIFLALVVVLAGLGVWFVRRPWPQVNGTIRVAGLQEAVEVLRDEWGVPHIYAQNEHDLFFAQGYVHAQDRLWQMEMNRRIGNGTLSEILGGAALGNDRYLRTIGLRRAAEQTWATLDEDLRAILEAYAAGVNAYIETHRDRLPLEFTILRASPEPWTPLDSLAWGNVMAMNLSANYTLEILRAQLIARLGEAAVQDLFPPPVEGTPLIVPFEAGQYEGLQGVPQGLVALDEWLGQPDTDWGSNNWVVHGSRTATGQPLLANDTHLGVQMPSVWYENDLHGGRFDSVGFTFPGVPLVILGHNQRIAWGSSNLGNDVQDLYLEKLDDPENPTQYEFMGEWRDLDVIHETIRVKGQEPVEMDIFLTSHGPLMNNVMGVPDADPMSVRWTLAEGNGLFRAIVNVNLATSWEEFHEALRDWDTPGQNMVYADVDGNIGYQATGKTPIRVPGHQGTVPVPGWTGEYEWQGYIPYDAMPYSFNPPVGFIVTANNQITPDDYPYVLACDWYPGYRAQRISEPLEAGTHLTVEDMQTIQADTYSLPAEALVPYLAALQPQDDLQAQALAQVETWDLWLEADRPGAAIYEVWLLHLLKNTISDDVGDDLMGRYLSGNYQRHASQVMPLMVNLMADADNHWFDDVTTPEVESRDDIAQRSLADAVTWLSERYGDDPAGWEWGRVHTITFWHTSLSRGPILGTIFNSKRLPARGDQLTVNAAGFNRNAPFAMNHGVSQRMIVDMSDLGNSLTIYTTGQSGQAFHPHREDLMSLWQNIEYHPMIFTRDAAEANVAASLTLMPR